MPLQKQPLNINFSQGLDLKTDPKQVQAGKFLALQNSVFTRGGLLQKRNGFPALPSLPSTTSTNLTTFNGNLLAIGTTFEDLSPDTGQWYDKGPFQPLSLSAQAAVRTSGSLTTVDYAIASNQLGLIAFTDSNGISYYQVVDSQTQQIIVNVTALPSTATLPRAFALGNFLIVTFLVTVAGTTHLRYISIPVFNPANPGPATDFPGASGTVKSLTAGYDGVTTNSNLYCAWAATSNQIKIAYITQTLSSGGTVTITGHTSTLMSLTFDLSQNPSNIWATFWDSSSMNGYTTCYNAFLNPAPVLAVTQVITGITIRHLTSTAINMVNTIFYETFNTYFYNNNVQSDFVSKITCTQSGTVGSAIEILRGVGIASKSFYLSGNIYLMMMYGGAYQPTLFLVDQFANVIAHLAYSNSLGYSTSQILPFCQCKR